MTKTEAAQTIVSAATAPVLEDTYNEACSVLVYAGFGLLVIDLQDAVAAAAEWRAQLARANANGRSGQTYASNAAISDARVAGILAQIGA